MSEEGNVIPLRAPDARTHRLQAYLEGFIRQYATKHGLTIAEAAGTLEVVKFNIISGSRQGDGE